MSWLAAIAIVVVLAVFAGALWAYDLLRDSRRRRRPGRHKGWRWLVRSRPKALPNGHKP